MTERPILFTPENAQKIFDGVKTQTRRIVKNDDWYACLTGDCDHDHADFCQREMATHCPYGVVGDRLWIREAVKMCSLSHKSWISLHYKGSGDQGEAIEIPWRDDHAPLCLTKFTPSIHMPRWACRTVVEITEIRVQRLQEISEEDARAEGAEFHDGRGIGHSGWRHDFEEVYADARSSFVKLWTSINGADSWNVNPWVWAITFKKVPA